jgi:hypothetical protein
MKKEDEGEICCLRVVFGRRPTLIVIYIKVEHKSVLVAAVGVVAEKKIQKKSS